MTTRTPAALAPPTDGGAPAAAVKSRDADNTRQLLLQAARRRFAYDGYSATTVRDIASDAGVNVALINRYFTSKEGLFEACLSRAVEELDRAGEDETSIELMVRKMIAHMTGPSDGDRPLQLLLLLRSSGDERADTIRVNTLRYFAERMVASAGGLPGDEHYDDYILRAQVALAASLGIVLLRSSTGLGLEPLASASADMLTGPLSEVFLALLAPAGDARR